MKITIHSETFTSFKLMKNIFFLYISIPFNSNYSVLKFITLLFVHYIGTFYLRDILRICKMIIFYFNKHNPFWFLYTLEDTLNRMHKAYRDPADIFILAKRIYSSFCMKMMSFNIIGIVKKDIKKDFLNKWYLKYAACCSNIVLLSHKCLQVWN